MGRSSLKKVVFMRKEVRGTDRNIHDLMKPGSMLSGLDRMVKRYLFSANGISCS
jgi:hypothetical protein